MRVVVYCVFVLCMFLFRFELQCTAARAHVEAESTPARPRLTEPPSPRLPPNPSKPPSAHCVQPSHKHRHTRTNAITARSEPLSGLGVRLSCGAHALRSLMRRNASPF